MNRRPAPVAARTRAALAAAGLLLALPAMAPAADAPASHDVSVLHCARLLDPVAGKLLGETTLIVDGGRIRELHAGSVDTRPYQAAATAAGGRYRYVDLPDATCLPGLIDAHTHLTDQTSPSRRLTGVPWWGHSCRRTCAN